MSQGRLREADRLFRKVLARSPTNGSAWTNRGHIARIQRRFPEAIRYYRRAVLEDPTSATAWPPLLRLTGRHGTPSDRRDLEAIRAEMEDFPRAGKRSKSPDLD
jgi:tetratricopeptide (TPR) repeat protein